LKLSVKREGRPFPRKDKIQEIISRSKNLELQIINTIVKYFDEQVGFISEMEKFLADFTLEPPSNRYQDESSPLLDTDDKPLVVSTIHSAKGLEWYTVFIPFNNHQIHLDVMDSKDD